MDISLLPHPVLVHLRSFFDQWDSFVLQALQTGQPYISDHLMFEVCFANYLHTHTHTHTHTYSHICVHISHAFQLS